MQRESCHMDNARSPLLRQPGGLVAADDGRGRWSRSIRDGARSLARALRRVATGTSPDDSAPAVPVIEPPDLHAAIGRLVYPRRSGAVVRLMPEMLGTDLMAAYPWSPEHGWTARN